MSLIDKFKSEFIDIIEWTEGPQSDVLAWRFPRYHNEIKMGAKLVGDCVAKLVRDFIGLECLDLQM